MMIDEIIDSFRHLLVFHRYKASTRIISIEYQVYLAVITDQYCVKLTSNIANQSIDQDRNYRLRNR